MSDFSYYDIPPAKYKRLFAAYLQNDGTQVMNNVQLYYDVINNYKNKAVEFWRLFDIDYLEDLYVKPAYRKNGYGLALLNWIVLKAKANNIKRVEWSVLNWNTPAIEFYQSLHAKSMDEWTTYRLDEHAINYLTKEKSVLE